MTLHPKQTEQDKWRFMALLAAVVFGAGAILLTFAVQSETTPRNKVILLSPMSGSGAPFRPGSTPIQARAEQLEEPVAADSLAFQQELPSTLFYPPVISDRPDDSSTLGNLENDASPGQTVPEAELKLLGAQAGQEATRRLQMLTRKYDLSKEQQALVFPVVARASPAYGQMSSLAGETLADAYVAQPESFPLLETRDFAEAPGSDDGAQNGQPEAEPTSQPKRSPAKTKLTFGPDDEEAPLITPEEQIDQYYWWGEILRQLNGDIEADAEAVSAALGSSTGTADETVAGSGSDAVPAAHQGGNLFDLLNE
jgi:hypothetical protein